MKILNELAHAEKLLKNGFSKFMSLVDLMVLAKYFRYLNKSNAEIEQELFKFCRTFAGEFSEIIFSDQIEKAIRYSKRYDLRIPVDVPITSKEVEAIKRLHNYRYEKIIFTMLVLGKYFKLTNSKNHTKEYYISESISTIYRLAHTSQKKDENIFHILYKSGFIDYILKTGSFILKFTNTDDDSPMEIVVTDISNITLFYPPYCKVCGEPLTKKSNSHSSCIKCQKEQRRQSKNVWRKKYYKETKL